MDTITTEAPLKEFHRPWVTEYPPGVPADVQIDPRLTLVDVLDEAFRRCAQRQACTCMGSTLRGGSGCLNTELASISGALRV
jgi:long-chain acyl-CoA synthetase